MIDYDVSIMPLKMKILYSTLAMCTVFAIAFMFYRSAIIALVICPTGLFYLKYKKANLIVKRRYELNLQFKDLLASLASSLSAGKAIENAFEYALVDLYVQHPNMEADIIKETKIIINKLSLNMTIEDAVSDFAKRSKLDDIKNFSDVIITCKRTGGNIIEAIKNASGIINDKIEMKQEIDTLLSSRRLEQKILNMMPLAIIFVLSTTAKEYMEPVFTTIQGRAAMTLCLILLLIAYLISKKIMDIKV